MDILIVTEDQQFISNFRSALDASTFKGEKLVIHGDAKTILNKIGKTKPEILFFDFNMPGIQIPVLFKKVCDIHPFLALVAVSDAKNIESYSESVELGFHSFLIKENTNTEILPVVINQAMGFVRHKKQLLESQRRLENLMDNLPGMVYRCLNDRSWTMKFLNGGSEELTGYRPDELVDNKVVSYGELILAEDRELVWDQIQKAVKSGRRFQIEYRIRALDGSIKWMWEQGGAFGEANSRKVLEGYIADITERRIKEGHLETIAEISGTLRRSIRPSEIAEKTIEKIIELFDLESAALVLNNEPVGMLHVASSGGVWNSFSGMDIRRDKCDFLDRSGELNYLLIHSGKEEEKDCPLLSSSENPFHGFFTMEGDSGQIGFLAVCLKKEFSDSDIRIFINIADLVSSALERSRLFIENEQQVRKLASLHTVDRAITSVLDSKVVSRIIVDELRSILEPDAVDILVLNRHLYRLEPHITSGFRDKDFRGKKISITNSEPGGVLTSRKPRHIPDLSDVQANFPGCDLTAEGFHAYFAEPMIVRGEPLGVLEVFMRKPFFPDKDWLSFLNAMAAEAAVALDLARQYEELERAKQKMSSSFHSTLESWSRSLEITDLESPGHNRRVTERTLELAKSFGLGEEELASIERGAILHDIGKIGIQEKILLKKTKLTEKDWDEIREHPVISKEMLSNIPFLQDSMEIPYSHHENWDGSGYPQGLKGEEIPLPARIFAVVETFDVLQCDRPYRSAWNREQAVEYLREQKGKRFDPEVVEQFLLLVGE